MPRKTSIIMPASWEISIREVPASGLQVVVMAAQPKNARNSQKLRCQINGTDWRQAAQAHSEIPVALIMPMMK